MIDRIAFLHIPKTGGVSVRRFLYGKLCVERPYVFRRIEFKPENLHESKLYYRNLTDSELQRYARSKEPLQFLPSHSPWSEETLRVFKENGWMVFSFVRHPGDLLCSSYFFNRDQYGFFLNVTLDDFLSSRLHARQMAAWHIPEFWAQLDFIREFKDSNIGDLVKNKLGLVFENFPKTNQSASFGYDYYCRTGEISKDTQRLLESHEQFRRFLDVKKLG